MLHVSRVAIVSVVNFNFGVCYGNLLGVGGIVCLFLEKVRRKVVLFCFMCII